MVHQTKVEAKACKQALFPPYSVVGGTGAPHLLSFALAAAAFPRHRLLLTRCSHHLRSTPLCARPSPSPSTIAVVASRRCFASPPLVSNSNCRRSFTVQRSLPTNNNTNQIGPLAQQQPTSTSSTTQLVPLTVTACPNSNRACYEQLGQMQQYHTSHITRST